MIDLSLHLLSVELLKMGKSIKDFDLPAYDIPQNIYNRIDSNRLIQGELDYDHLKLQEELDNNLHRMNSDQKSIYDSLLMVQVVKEKLSYIILYWLLFAKKVI